MAGITVLIVDDDPIVREGLAGILETQPDIEVIGEAANGREAVALAEVLRPCVVLTDVAMPELDGIAAAREIKRARPETTVIFWSVYGHHLMEALAAGGSRYLLKDCSVAELLQAIRGGGDPSDISAEGARWR